MIYDLKDTEKVLNLFNGWQETLIYSCLQKVMGKIYVTRYAIKKETQFDKEYLRNIVMKLSEGYELKEIDERIYDMCLPDPVTRDFVSAFGSKEKYLEIGRGMVILKSSRIVAGASSYTRYNEGIEIEVDTVEERRKEQNVWTLKQNSFKY